MSHGTTESAAEPLFELDRKARQVFLAHRRDRAVKVLDRLGDAGDQPPLRWLSGAVLALGLIRGDTRMMRAGAKMLLAHELATAAKTRIKHRIDRSRPRSANGMNGHLPKPGHDNSKEETSFPSGHAAGSMAVALALATEYPQHRAAGIAASAAIGLSRIPTCAHYPSDVAAGWVVGALSNAAIGLAWRGMLMVFRRNYSQS